MYLLRSAFLTEIFGNNCSRASSTPLPSSVSTAVPSHRINASALPLSSMHAAATATSAAVADSYKRNCYPLCLGIVNNFGSPYEATAVEKFAEEVLKRAGWTKTRCRQNWTPHQRPSRWKLPIVSGQAVVPLNEYSKQEHGPGSTRKSLETLPCLHQPAPHTTSALSQSADI